MKHLEDYSRDIEAEFQTMAKYAKECSDMPCGRPSIIFCFDKANALISHDVLSFLGLRFALRRQKMVNRMEDIFGILIDTNPKFNPYIPRIENYSTSKVIHEPKGHFLPIFEMNVDECREIATTLRELLSIKDDQTDYQRTLSMRRN